MGDVTLTTMAFPGGFDEQYAFNASPLRFDQVHPGGNRGGNIRSRSTRLQSMPVTTVAGGYHGNPYLCGTHVEASPHHEREYLNSREAHSMMRYGYGAPFNPQHHLSGRPFNHNYANNGSVYAPNAKMEPRPRYFFR